MVVQVGANVLQNTKQYKNAFQYDAYRPLQWSYLRGGDVYPGEVSGREGCPGVSTPLDPVADTTLWTEWLTDRGKNITLASTSFASGNNNRACKSLLIRDSSWHWCISALVLLYWYYWFCIDLIDEFRPWLSHQTKTLIGGTDQSLITGKLQVNLR